MDGQLHALQQLLLQQAPTPYTPLPLLPTQQQQQQQHDAPRPTHTAAAKRRWQQPYYITVYAEGTCTTENSQMPPKSR